jgi:SM-20-related protein
MIWLESLLDELSKTGLCYSDSALSLSQRTNWLQVLKQHQEQKLFRPASIGRESTLQNNSAIRNDEISWLEPARAGDAAILTELDQWRRSLNESLFLSTRTIEAHFAHYDPGHFYRRHKDRFDSQNSRVLTFVAYLHSDWKNGDGGELVVNDGDTDLVRQIIQPLPGRVVIFRSDDIWHEVRKSNFERFSLTGWFRYDAGPFTRSSSAN